MKFEIGERYVWFWEDRPEDKYTTGPLIFVGTGEESYKLYREYSDHRKRARLVIMDSTSSWYEVREGNGVVYRKLTKLEKALR